MTEQGVVEVEPGIRIHYTIRGSGEPALLVPNGSWVAGPLAPLARGRRVVGYDLRGRGRSSPVEDPSRLGALRAGKVHRTDPRLYAREWMRHYLLPQQVARKEHVDLVPLDACDLPNEFPESWIPGWLDAVYPSLGDWDWRPRLPELDVPVLLVWGETDRAAPEAEQEWLGGLRRGALLVVPGSGHWPFCENPGAFFPEVERFLAGEPVAAP